jgi:predicted transcriptional regulator
MRKGTPMSDLENVITVYGGTDSWKQRMGYQSPDAAYLVLIDKHGAVRWRHSGAFDEEAYKNLYAQVSGLLREP